jgi:hypothetical protein
VDKRGDIGPHTPVEKTTAAEKRAGELARKPARTPAPAPDAEDHVLKRLSDKVQQAESLKSGNQPQ